LTYQERTYRYLFAQKDMLHFQITHKDSDLDIGIPREQFCPEMVSRAKALIEAYRRQLEMYIEGHPHFAFTLVPCDTLPEAPAIAREMAAAARMAGVGPMAAVAGAIAQYVALDLVGPTAEIIVENGGDIYLNSYRPRNIGIYAGESSCFSNRLALKVTPELCPLGICTSSGTVGHSLSFGHADAAVIMATSAPLADAVATAAANVVQQPLDVEKAARLAATIPGVLGAVIIAGDKLAAWGKVTLERV
jgi:ApbE superfamily uncharacterized protein (UPF0280 family)